MDPSSPLLRFEPGLIIWEVGAFLILLLVLRKIAWSRLLAALDERERRISESLDQAQKTHRDAEKLIGENQQRIDRASQKSEQIIQQAREQAEQAGHQILEEGRAEARRVIEQGMRRLEAEQRSALQVVRSVAAALAIQAAARLIQVSLDERRQRELVNQFLKEIPEGPDH